MNETNEFVFKEIGIGWLGIVKKKIVREIFMNFFTDFVAE